MRLISKFRDYYDCIQAMGYDDYPVYVRETREIKSPEKVNKSIEDNEKRNRIASITMFSNIPRTDGVCTSGVVAFCGRAYPFYSFENKCYYHPNKLEKALVIALRNRDHPNYENIRGLLKKIRGEEHHYRSRWSHPDLSKESWKRYIDGFNWDVNLKTFRYFDSPIIATSEEEGIALEVNPLLRSYNFEQIKDPYTAWQEISMFLGNELVTQRDPNPHIPDVIKAQSKGFDKWSFRKHADDSKKPRKRNK